MDLINWLTRSVSLFRGRTRSINRITKVLSFRFTRGSEKEADRLAAQYLWRAGYDPGALITFLEKVGAQEKKSRIPLRNLFRTHPVSEDRIRDTTELVARFPKKDEYQLNSSSFIALKERRGIEKYEWDRVEPKKKRRLPPIKIPKIPPIRPPIFRHQP